LVIGESVELGVEGGISAAQTRQQTPPQTPQSKEKKSIVKESIEKERESKEERRNHPASQARHPSEEGIFTPSPPLLKKSVYTQERELPALNSILYPVGGAAKVKTATNAFMSCRAQPRHLFLLKY